MTIKKAGNIAFGIVLILISFALKKMIKPVKRIIKKIDDKVERMQGKR